MLENPKNVDFGPLIKQFMKYQKVFSASFETNINIFRKSGKIYLSNDLGFISFLISKWDLICFYFFNWMLLQFFYEIVNLLSIIQYNLSKHWKYCSWLLIVTNLIVYLKREVWSFRHDELQQQIQESFHCTSPNTVFLNSKS